VNGETKLIGIDEGSPAYCFYKKCNFDELSIEFCDPHNKHGGFGASSAQFSLLYRLYLQSVGKEFDFDIGSFLTEYKQLSGQNCGVVPSGADCVAQYFNYSIFFDSVAKTAEKADWNFPNLDYFIFPTGYKIATHTHLRELAAFDIEDLQKCTLGVRESFGNNDEEALVKNVRFFFDLLIKNNLVFDNSIRIVERLLKVRGIRAAKGCGASGADTVLVIFEKSEISRESLINEINSIMRCVV
jgi:hypothetical protein